MRLLNAFWRALKVFVIGVVLCFVAILGAVGLEWLIDNQPVIAGFTVAAFIIFLLTIMLYD